jgi:hypothetical protein
LHSWLGSSSLHSWLGSSSLLTMTHVRA